MVVYEWRLVLFTSSLQNVYGMVTGTRITDLQMTAHE